MARDAADHGEEAGAGIITGVLREQRDQTSLEVAGHFKWHRSVFLVTIYEEMHR